MSPQGSYVKLMFDIWFPSCKVMAEESFPFRITSERTKRVLSVTYYFLSAYSSILYCKLLQGVLQTQTHIRTQIFKYFLQRQDFSSKFLWCFDSTLHFSVTKSFFYGAKGFGEICIVSFHVCSITTGCWKLLANLIYKILPSNLR